MPLLFSLLAGKAVVGQSVVWSSGLELRGTKTDLRGMLAPVQ